MNIEDRFKLGMNERYIKLAIKQVAEVTTMTENFVRSAYHGDVSIPPVWQRIIKFAVDQAVVVLQVDDVLVVEWIVVKDNNYKKALAEMVGFNITLDHYEQEQKQLTAVFAHGVEMEKG